MARPSHLSPDNILRFLQVRTDPASIDDISRGLHMHRSDRGSLIKMLSKLKKRGAVREFRRDCGVSTDDEYLALEMWRTALVCGGALCVVVNQPLRRPVQACKRARAGTPSPHGFIEAVRAEMRRTNSRAS